MWTRKELKTRAKAAVKRNYWKSVLVGLLALFLTGVSVSSGSNGTSWNDVETDLQNIASSAGVSMNMVIGILVGFAGAALLISLLIWTFIRNPLCVGVARFFTKNAESPAAVKEVGYAFGGGHYLRCVGALFLANLFAGLWAILFIIPGIVKVYDYYMVPYIMADDPEIGAMDALKKSKEMMRGHRWNTFVLNLSFIGWKILGTLTLGIVEVLYVTPYCEATDAELYLTLKNQD